MIINKDTSFIKTYFDGKEGDELRATITPNWNKETLDSHIKLISIPENTKTVLEVGCGIGRILREIYDKNELEHCIGVDASVSMIDEGIAYVGDRNIDMIECDGNGELELLRDDYFDFSFSIITFQHIPNTETVKKYISEMLRVTKSGGEIMFQVLTKDKGIPGLWSYHPVRELLSHLVSLDKTHYSITKEGRWSIIRCKV